MARARGLQVRPRQTRSVRSRLSDIVSTMSYGRVVMSVFQGVDLVVSSWSLGRRVAGSRKRITLSKSSICQPLFIARPDHHEPVHGAQTGFAEEISECCLP